MPYCFGALDGKHIRIRKPKISGKMYFNYTLFFSIVHIAVVTYNFIRFNVGGVDHQSDAQIYNALKSHNAFIFYFLTNKLSYLITYDMF